MIVKYPLKIPIGRSSCPQRLHSARRSQKVALHLPKVIEKSPRRATREVTPEGNASGGQLFAPAACVPRPSDSSLLCWPKRLNLVGSPINSTEGRVAAQRWAGAPPRIVDFHNVTYRTSQKFGQIWYPPFHGKFAVVADGDPPLQLRTNGQPNPGSWMLGFHETQGPGGSDSMKCQVPLYG